jgi:protein-L-isoaspartate O-methyltransferase
MLWLVCRLMFSFHWGRGSTGSGYLTACLRELVGPTGRVVGVEMHKPLADRAREALQRWHPGVLEDGSVVLLQGNALLGQMHFNQLAKLPNAAF